MRKSAIAFLIGISSLAAYAQSPSTPLNVYDGFETEPLSDLWETLSLAPGSATVQSSIVRAGHGALRITVKPHDVFEAGRNGNHDSERDEIFDLDEMRRCFLRSCEKVWRRSSIFYSGGFRGGRSSVVERSTLTPFC